MTSRREFVIGSGTLLAGSGTFLGSGAFGVSAGDDPGNWVPVGVRALSSEGLESSTGIGTDDQETKNAGETPRGEQEGDDGQGEDDSDDRDEDEDEDRDDDEGEDRDRDSDDSDSSDDNRTPSLRLISDARRGDILDSEQVRRNEDDELELDIDANPNAWTYVGERSEPAGASGISRKRYPRPDAGDAVAFVIRNDGNTPVDVRVEVDGSTPDVLNLPAAVGTGVTGPRYRNITEVPVKGLQPGGEVHVTVEVDMTSPAPDDIPDDGIEGITFICTPESP